VKNGLHEGDYDSPEMRVGDLPPGGVSEKERRDANEEGKATDFLFPKAERQPKIHKGAFVAT
jgi:hypothetical protein